MSHYETDAPPQAGDTDLIELGRRYEQARTAAEDAVRVLEAAQQAADEYAELRCELQLKILSTPARTLAGLQVKARAVQDAIGPDDGAFEYRVAQNLISDLLAIPPDPALSGQPPRLAGI